MPTPRLTRAQAEEAVAAVSKHGGCIADAAKSLGLKRTTLRDRVIKAKIEFNIVPGRSTKERVANVMPTLAPTLEQGFEVVHSEKQTKIWSLGDEVQTVEEAIAKAGLDMARWMVKQAKVKQYAVPMKLNQGQKLIDLEDEEQDANGLKKKIRRQSMATQEELTHREVVWLVEVTVAPRSNKFLFDALDEIHDRAALYSPSYELPPLPKGPSDLLYEISLFDHHFGKLCWAVETGQNYDLSIAEAVFDNAVEDLLARSGDRQVERFLFPIGQDLLHVDNSRGTTTAGTYVDWDGRYAKVVETAFFSLVKAIDKLILRAPVDIVFVPGNHDKHCSYHIARELAAWYRLTDRVNVDSTLRKRKYYQFGCVLLGLAHADTEKSKWTTLPNLMATERPKEWAATTHHEWHLGHLHSKHKRETLPVEEIDGVVMRVLSSLSGLDRWHYESGYFSKRAAEGYLWSRNEGYVGHFNAPARE